MLVLGLIGASLSMMFIAYKNEKGEAFDSISLRKPAMQRVVLILAATMIFAFIMKPLSFILGGMLYLFAVTYVLGNRKWKQMLLVSIIAPIVVFYVFKNVLGITLPMGILKFILR
jgi:putative tricarboxylic transport membrane protein